MKKYWLPFALIIFFLFIVILADSGNLPRFIKNLYNFPYGDKVGHFLLMGLLSYSLNRTAITSHFTLQKTKRNNRDLDLPRVLWMVNLALAFFITLEELSQQFFPKRTFSLIDLAFSYAGIAFFAWLAIKTTKKLP